MANQMRTDPTRTTVLRRQFVRDMDRRFKWLIKQINELIIDLDVFGLKKDNPLTIFAANASKQAWRFASDTQKVTEFRKWLQTQVDAGILEVNKTPPWTAEYVESAYKKGMIRAYADTVKSYGKSASFYKGSQSQFILDAFNQPETMRKIELIYTRAYTDLKGVTDAIGQKLSNVLASGLVSGEGPLSIAREMTRQISSINKQRARVIARTEIISAHAEGQLDSFEKLGVEELTIRAEWSTAGDDRVCELCAPMEGAVLTIDQARNLIPRHPNCRCMWIPANVGESKKGQLWGSRGKARIKESIERQGGKKKSSWFGKKLI